jgi:hypothetical protein
VEKTTRQPATGTAWTAVTNASISSSFFTAGKKYLIVANAQVDGSAVTAAAKTKVTHGSTDFADSVDSLEPDAVGVRYTYTWWTVWTAGSSEGISMHISSATAAGITGIDLSTLMAIKLSDDLVENTDWFFAENSTATTLTTSESSSNNASVTFTPSEAGNVLVLSRARFTLTGAGSTVEYLTRLTRAGEASSNLPEIRRQMENATTESPVFTNMRVFSVSSGVSNTFAEKSLAQVATGGSRSHSGIFVLKLTGTNAKIRNTANSTYATSVTINNTTAYAVNVATTSLTPAVQGDVVILGGWTYRTNTLTATARGRLQVDNTDSPINQTSKNYTRADNQVAAEKQPVQNVTMLNLNTSAHTIDLDGSTTATGSTRLAEGVQLVAFTMELVPQPQTLIEVVDEEVELPEQDLDESRFVNAVRLPPTDSVQIAEPVHPLVRIRNIKPGPSDFQSGDFLADDFLVVTPSGPEIEGPVTISESIITKILAPGVRVVDTEPVQITDAAYHIISKLRQINESIEISETISNLANLTREGSPLDSVSVSEIVTLLRDLTRILDTEGIDISEVINHIKYITKIIGRLPATTADFIAADFVSADFVTAIIPGEDYVPISEAVNKTLQLLRIIGVGDPGYAIEGFLETGYTSRLVDAINVSESAPLKILGKAKVINESLQLLEEVSQVGGVIPQITRVIDESVEISDLLNRLTNQVRAVDESLSVEEAQNVALNLIRIHTEQVEIAETLSQNKALTRVIEESAEILEAAERNLSLARVVNETQQLVESITQAMSKIRIVDEQVDIADHITHILTEPGIIKKIVPAEGVDISETIEKVQALVRSIDESVNLEETVPYIRALVRVLNETIELSDTQVPITGKAQVVTEAVEVADDILTKLETQVAPPSVHHVFPRRKRRKIPWVGPIRALYQDVYPQQQPQEPEKKPEPEKPPRIKATLTIRYDIAAAKQYINIDQLVARALIASLQNTIIDEQHAYGKTSRKASYPTADKVPVVVPLTHRGTITPKLRQSDTKLTDVILLKDTVTASLTPVYNQAVSVSINLKIPYNVTQTVTKDATKISYDRLQTVTASLTSLYNNSVSIGKITLQASYNMKSGPKYRWLENMHRIVTANNMMLRMIDEPEEG